MKMFSKTISMIAILSIVLLASCDTAVKKSDLLDKVISTNNLSQIAKDMRDDPLVSKNEIDYFTNSVAKYSQTKDSLIGNTVGYLIEKEKSALKNTSSLLLVTAASKAEMNMQYIVRFIKMEPLKNDKTDQKLNRIHYNFQNNSEKDIKSINGMMQFYTANNQLIKQFELRVNKPDIIIKKGETMEFHESFVFNEEDQRDVLIRTSKDLRVRWQPIAIEYTDGTKLGL